MSFFFKKNDVGDGETVTKYESLMHELDEMKNRRSLFIQSLDKALSESKDSSHEFEGVDWMIYIHAVPNFTLGDFLHATGWTILLKKEQQSIGSYSSSFAKNHHFEEYRCLKTLNDAKITPTSGYYSGFQLTLSVCCSEGAYLTFPFESFMIKDVPEYPESWKPTRI